MTISALAGTGSPVNGAGITSSGAPRRAPAYSYSLTPAFAADGAAIQVAGSQPSTMATGQARLACQYLRAICLPCLCSMIHSVTRSLPTTQERYVPTLTQPLSGSLVTT